MSSFRSTPSRPRPLFPIVDLLPPFPLFSSLLFKVVIFDLDPVATSSRPAVVAIRASASRYTRLHIHGTHVYPALSPSLGGVLSAAVADVRSSRSRLTPGLRLLLRLLSRASPTSLYLSRPRAPSPRMSRPRSRSRSSLYGLESLDLDLDLDLDR